MKLSHGINEGYSYTEWQTCSKSSDSSLAYIPNFPFLKGQLQDDVLWWWWKVRMSKLMGRLKKNQLKVKQKGHEKARNRALEF